jgi:hypothetical protein
VIAYDFCAVQGNDVTSWKLDVRIGGIVTSAEVRGPCAAGAESTRHDKTPLGLCQMCQIPRPFA